MDSNNETIRLFGFGVYDGDFIPAEDVRFLGMGVPFENPRITLDSGDVVWGCECWWGKESDFERLQHGRAIEHVSIIAMRNKYNAPQGEQS
jgi:hypothetical protein